MAKKKYIKQIKKINTRITATIKILKLRRVSFFKNKRWYMCNCSEIEFFQFRSKGSNVSQHIQEKYYLNYFSTSKKISFGKRTINIVQT